MFIQSYTFEKVERTYERKWDVEAFHLIPQEMITPLKTKLEHVFRAYGQ